MGERDENRLLDWRRKLSLYPPANTAFRQGCATLQAHTGQLPAKRGLVHADLLTVTNQTCSGVLAWG